MLILSRKPGQSIIIGGIIEVTVAEVRGDQVRIGITAPRCVPVFRTEVLESQNDVTLSEEDQQVMLDILSRYMKAPVMAAADAAAHPSTPLGNGESP